MCGGDSGNEYFTSTANSFLSKIDLFWSSNFF